MNKKSNVVDCPNDINMVEAQTNNDIAGNQDVKGIRVIIWDKK